MRVLKDDRKWNKHTPISVLGITLLIFSMFLSIAGAAPFAYIPNTGDNTISMIDTSTDTILKLLVDLKQFIMELRLALMEKQYM
jgi:hypothetical protein